MRQITVDADLEKSLSERREPAVLCDRNGRALGYFSPVGERIRVGELELDVPLSIAETEELRKVKTGKPLEEILNRLGIS